MQRPILAAHPEKIRQQERDPAFAPLKTSYNPAMAELKALQ